MFVSVLTVYHLFDKRVFFYENFRYEIVCTNTVGTNNAKYRYTSKVSPLPKQNLLFIKLIRLYLHIYKIRQVGGVPKGLNNLSIR